MSHFAPLLIGLAALSGARPQPQALVRLTDGAPPRQLAAVPVSFGLTQTQRQRLYELTAGRVDLRNFYRVRGAGPQTPGFQNLIGPVVSPVAVVGPAGEVRGD